MVSCLRLGCGEGERRRRENDFTRLVRPATSERSCSISTANCGVAQASRCTAEIEGVATSMMSSAICASCVKVVSRLADARTILTLEGSFWRKCSQTKALSGGWSPSSCCIRRSNCVGFRSPSSSVLSNCCSLCCSEAPVRLISCSLSTS